MSAALEAALSQLGLIERNDLATMAIAKVIIGLAKRGRSKPPHEERAIEGPAGSCPMGQASLTFFGVPPATLTRS
jgi:hypothetical protein